MSILARDQLATMNKDTQQVLFPNGIDVVSDTGQTLFCVNLTKEGALRITASGVCRNQGVLLDDAIRIKPEASNSIIIERPLYK